MHSKLDPRLQLILFPMAAASIPIFWIAISFFSGRGVFGLVGLWDAVFMLLIGTTVILTIWFSMGWGLPQTGQERAGGPAPYAMMTLLLVRNVPALSPDYTPYFRVAAFILFGILTLQALAGVFFRRAFLMEKVVGWRTNVSEATVGVERSSQNWITALVQNGLLLLVFAFLTNDVERSVIEPLRRLDGKAAVESENQSLFTSFSEGFSELRTGFSKLHALATGDLVSDLKDLSIED